MKYAIVCDDYVLTVGERYKVVRPILFGFGPTKESMFYGTCNSITTVPIFNKFIRVQFIDVVDYLNEPCEYHKTMIVDIISINPNDWRFMKIMDPQLTSEIKGHKQIKIPSLSYLCRKHIPYDMKVEYQGTYINDIIVGNN